MRIGNAASRQFQLDVTARCWMRRFHPCCRVGVARGFQTGNGWLSPQDVCRGRGLATSVPPGCGSGCVRRRMLLDRASHVGRTVIRGGA